MNYEEKIDMLINYAKSLGIDDWRLKSDDESVTIELKVKK